MLHKLKLAIESVEYRGKYVILLKFKYNEKLKELSKSIGCRWSQFHRSWYINYSIENLRLIYDTFKDETDIDFSKVKSISKKEDKKPISVEIPKEYTNLLIRRRYSDNTKKVYSYLFKEFIQYYSDTKPEDITEAQIRAYQDYLVKKRQISISTQNQAINAIKFYYEKVLSKDKVDYHIERPRREKKLPEVISEKELLKILKATDNIKHKTIITLLYSSGMRRGELIELRIQDVNFDKKIIFIRGGKGKKDRTTILADYAALVLRKYLNLYHPNYWLIEGVNRKQYSPTSIGAILKSASIKAKLNKIVKPHMLRHSFATHMLEQGVDLRYIQTLLGHGSPKTTEIYTRVTSYSLAKIKSPFDKIFESKVSNDKGLGE